MDKSAWIKNLVQKLTSEKGKNYSYLTLFFLTFSVFVFAAIRPSLKTAFSLKQEEVSLKQINADYEQAITKIIAIQQGLEVMRDDLFLLSQAVPERPQVNKLIEDIESIGARNSVILSEVSVGDVNLIERGSTSVKNLTLKMSVSSSFPNILNFLSDLSNQRRIKVSDNIQISAGENATGSAELNISMDVEGYHL